MVWLTNLLEKPAGRNAAIALVIVAIGAAGYVIYGYFAHTPLAMERNRIFIDSTNMQPFHHELEKGESIPCDAPSGGKTGYPAELCFWTKDGQPKSDPTPVLLNTWLGKPEPTFCPDCGRLVIANNPPADPGRRPPPTRQEWERWHSIGLGPELLHTVASGN